jgi:AcrR family transcriptional regulator
MIEAKMPLRNEPVQARSAARLTSLLDSAAAIIDEVGFERLTTAMVAERAGASIGTVYRYFPDRIALLQALGSRNLERILSRVGDNVLDDSHRNWFDALAAAFGIVVEAFRDEPGFRGLRVGDVIDLRPTPTARPYKAIVTDQILDGLIARYEIEDSADLRFSFETAAEVSEALAARAFARSTDGDDKFLVAGRDIVYTMLKPYFGEAEF